MSACIKPKSAPAVPTSFTGVLRQASECSSQRRKQSPASIGSKKSFNGQGGLPCSILAFLQRRCKEDAKKTGLQMTSLGFSWQFYVHIPFISFPSLLDGPALILHWSLCPAPSCRNVGHLPWSWCNLARQGIASLPTSYPSCRAKDWLHTAATANSPAPHVVLEI